MPDLHHLHALLFLQKESLLAQGERLWVDKYAPRSFLELLGDEEINREVVKWLKCWDRAVFGGANHQPLRPGASTGHNRAAGGKHALETRPEEKILLICGAPGISLCLVLQPSMRQRDLTQLSSCQ